MFKNINLVISTINSKIVYNNIKKVSFYGNNGYMTLLPNHIDLIATFQPHIISFCDENNVELYLNVHSGVLTKKENTITISTIYMTLTTNISSLKQISSQNDIFNNIAENLSIFDKYI